jgi:hypothetical protein
VNGPDVKVIFENKSVKVIKDNLTFLDTASVSKIRRLKLSDCQKL